MKVSCASSIAADAFATASSSRLWVAPSSARARASLRRTRARRSRTIPAAWVAVKSSPCRTDCPGTEARATRASAARPSSVFASRILFRRPSALRRIQSRVAPRGKNIPRAGERTERTPFAQPGRRRARPGACRQWVRRAPMGFRRTLARRTLAGGVAGRSHSADKVRGERL